MSKTYTDKRGYLRFKDSDKLVHRWVAYTKIYKENKEDYPLPFREYQVHHINKNKKYNDKSNLMIVTEEEHGDIHRSFVGNIFVSIFRALTGR